jgi:NAD(P)-dependent dehydrogenase (short-subunit alcohol dehydrogenase family)
METARALSSAGADVVLCSRSAEAGEKVAAEIRSSGIKGTVTVKSLDLADLASISDTASQLNSELSRLDVLVLNAGVMACPLSRTKDGFEMQARTGFFNSHQSVSLSFTG